MDSRRVISALSPRARSSRDRSSRDGFSRNGFSLLELTIVIVIIGIVAVIALQRFSRGSRGADEAGQAKNLQSLRKAIELYHVEHGRYPTLAGIHGQLTQYTDEAGNVSPTRSAPHLLGPYLRGIPSSRGRTQGKVVGVVQPNADWLYNEASGTVEAIKE